jgi:hypothetical protein
MKKPPLRVAEKNAGFKWAIPMDRPARSSVELFFGVGLDGAVRGGVGDAGEDEAGLDLVVVEEALVRLVDGAGGELASAGGAGAGAAGVGQVDALLFSGVEDVLVVGNLDGLVQPSLSLTRVTL